MIIKLIEAFFTVYYFMILTRIVASWIPSLQNHHLMQFVYYYTEPYLGFFRKLIPPLGQIDLSPLLAMLALNLIKMLVIGIFL